MNGPSAARAHPKGRSKAKDGQGAEICPARNGRGTRAGEIYGTCPLRPGMRAPPRPTCRSIDPVIQTEQGAAPPPKGQRLILASFRPPYAEGQRSCSDACASMKAASRRRSSVTPSVVRSRLKSSRSGVRMQRFDPVRIGAICKAGCGARASLVIVACDPKPLDRGWVGERSEMVRCQTRGQSRSWQRRTNRQSVFEPFAGEKIGAGACFTKPDRVAVQATEHTFRGLDVGQTACLRIEKTREHPVTAAALSVIAARSAGIFKRVPSSALR